MFAHNSTNTIIHSTIIIFVFSNTVTTSDLVLLSVPYNVVTTHSRYLTAYPLTKRNGLVNQVEILGLAHTLVTFKTILQQTPSKEVPMLKWI